jgi:hypothetical protein
VVQSRKHIRGVVPEAISSPRESRPAVVDQNLAVLGRPGQRSFSIRPTLAHPLPAVDLSLEFVRAGATPRSESTIHGQGEAGREGLTRFDRSNAIAFPGTE